MNGQAVCERSDGRNAEGMRVHQGGEPRNRLDSQRDLRAAKTFGEAGETQWPRTDGWKSLPIRSLTSSKRSPDWQSFAQSGAGGGLAGRGECAGDRVRLLDPSLRCTGEKTVAMLH